MFPKCLVPLAPWHPRNFLSGGNRHVADAIVGDRQVADLAGEIEWQDGGIKGGCTVGYRAGTYISLRCP